MSEAGKPAPSVRGRLVVVLAATALVVLAAVVALVVLQDRHAGALAVLDAAGAGAPPATSSGAVEAAADGLVAVSLLLVLTVLLGGLAVAIVLCRSMALPLAALGADARAATVDPARPVRTDGPAEVAVVARDVEGLRSELSRRLDAAAQDRAELEAAHRALAEQAEDLRRSNADLEQFAYVASHDLQEPLRKVASFTQLLARRYEGQLDARADEYIGYAVDGARRMQRLVDDLLGFARVGRPVGRPQDVDLADLLAEVVHDLHGVIEPAGAEVHGEGLPVVRGDRALLTQLLANLVRNAVTYRAEQPPVVRFDARRVENHWELACQDNGRGIDPADAERVFVLFERVGQRPESPGTGIGLALCRRIVEHHGGRIWVDTEVTSGATLRWTLPA